MDLNDCIHCGSWKTTYVETVNQHPVMRRYKCRSCGQVFTVEGNSFTAGWMPGKTAFFGGISIPGAIIRIGGI